ncbi:MAG: DUF58 domain-containing protein [Sumerlaeia bacterium]
MQTEPTLRILTSRNILLLLASFGLYAGIMLRNPLAAMVGFVALGALLRSGWQAFRLLRGMKVRREHHSRAFEGQTLPVTLEIESENRAATSMLLVEDVFPPGASYKVRHLVEDPLRRGETASLGYLGECVHRRGPYTLGPVRFEALDDLGLFRRQLFMNHFTNLILYPSGAELRVAQVLGEGTLPHVGVQTTRRAGQSEEFVGLREYRVGDNPNAVHWRSSARTGDLKVKEFQEEITTEVTVFLDLGRMGLTGLGDQTSVEYGIKAAASLAKRAIELSHHVQLFAIGGDRVEHIPTGSGNNHLAVILDRLTFMKAEGDVDFPAEAMRRLPLLRRGGTAILIQGVTTIDPDRAAMLVAAFAQRRILPIMVLVDDRSFIKLYAEQEIRHVTALSLEETVRHLTLLGARVHVLTKAKTPQDALTEGLETVFLSRMTA